MILVYTYNDDKITTIVAIYVDDLIVASNDELRLQQLKENLKKSFDMKDLGKISYGLGIKFNQNKDEITMSQRKYTQEILKKLNMENCKPISTSIKIAEKLTKAMCPKTEEEAKRMQNIPYQELIGALMYLALFTRPDIAHAVSVLGQFNANYGTQHWAAAKRVLRYLKRTQDVGLKFVKGNESLTGFADADWGASTDDRRSYTGFAFILANAAEQRTVAMSSTEAEYMSLSDSSKAAIHLRRLLEEILDDQKTTTIYNDNQGAGLLSKNPVFHNRTKHVGIRHHFIRECIERGNVELKYIATTDMPKAQLMFKQTWTN